MGIRLLIVGANGLVGQGVLQAALRDPQVDQITVLTRRPMSGLPASVASLVAPAFTDAQLGTLPWPDVDACLYCAGALPIGMTERAYREVTVDATVAVARALAAQQPRCRFLYVSGMGADARSPVMPLRVKGQAEAALDQLGLVTTHVRPGIVAPQPGVNSPHRWRQQAYALGAPMLRWAARWMPGMMTTTEAIGRAMLHAARLQPAPHALDNGEINRLASGARGDARPAPPPPPPSPAPR